MAKSSGSSINLQLKVNAEVTGGSIDFSGATIKGLDQALQNALNNIAPNLSLNFSDVKITGLDKAIKNSLKDVKVTGAVAQSEKANTATTASSGASAKAKAASGSTAADLTKVNNLLKQVVNSYSRVEQAQQKWQNAASGTASGEYAKLEQYKTAYDDITSSVKNGTMTLEKAKEQISQVGLEYAQTIAKLKSAKISDTNNALDMGDEDSLLLDDPTQYANALSAVADKMVSIRKQMQAISAAGGEDSGSYNSLANTLDDYQALFDMIQSGEMTVNEFAENYTKLTDAMKETSAGVKVAEENIQGVTARLDFSNVTKSLTGVNTAVKQVEASLNSAFNNNQTTGVASYVSELREEYNRLEAVVQTFKSTGGQGFDSASVTNQANALKQLAQTLKQVQALETTAYTTGTSKDVQNLQKVIELYEKYANLVKSTSTNNGMANKDFADVQQVGSAIDALTKASQTLATFNANKIDLGLADDVSEANTLNAAIADLAQRIQTASATGDWSSMSASIQAVIDRANAANTALNNLMQSSTWDSQSVGIKNSITALQDVGLNVDSLSQKYAELRTKMSGAKDTGDYSQAASINADIAAIEKEIQVQQKRVNTMKQVESKIAEITKAQKEWTAAASGSTSSDYKNLDALKQKYQELAKAIKDGTISQQEAQTKLTSLNASFSSASNAIRAAGKDTESLSSKFIRLTKEFTSWMSVTAVFMQAVQTVKQMVNAVIDIDTAMTELKKVTNETSSTYSSFLESSIQRAKELGSTVDDVVTSTADFARLGYTIDEASSLADSALIYKNVGDGIEDISEASESIISTMKAFGIEAEDSMNIVDEFNEVGNNFAISSQGVGEALQESASALAAGGNSLEESIGLITAMNSTVQNTSKVGTTLKTLSMYLRASKTEAEAAGESTEGMADSVSKLREELLSLTGGKLDIMLDEDTYKSTYQIMLELSQVWDELTDVSQANITELVAGKRNSDAMLSLLKNMSTAQEVVEAASNASGSAIKENETYLNSIEGHITTLKASFQELSSDFIDTGVVTSIVDIGNALLNVADAAVEFTNKFGGIKVLLATLGTFATSSALTSLLKAIQTGSKFKGLSKLWSDLSGSASIFTEEFSKGLANGSNVATKFTSGISAGFAGVAQLINPVTLGVTGLTAALTAGVVIWQAYQEKLEQQMSDAASSAEALEKETQSIEDYKSQVESLRESLDSGTLSQQEAYDARAQLLEIQNALISNYGSEAEGIELVTGAVNEQIAALDSLAASRTNDWYTENYSAIKRANKQFYEVYNGDSTRTLGSTTFNDDLYELQEVLTDVGLSYEGLQSGIWNITTTGIDNIYEMVDALTLAKNTTVDWAQQKYGTNYMDYADDLINSIQVQIDNLNELIDGDMGTTADKYAEYLLTNTDAYAEIYEQTLGLQEIFNEAVTSGDYKTQMSAMQKIIALRDAMNNADWSDEAAVEYMNRIFEAILGEDDEYEIELKLKLDLQDSESDISQQVQPVIDKIKELGNLTDADSLTQDWEIYGDSIVEAMENGEGAANDYQSSLYSLYAIAEANGLTFNEFIGILEECGVVTSGIADETETVVDQMATLSRSYADMETAADSLTAVQSNLYNSFGDNASITEDAYNAMLNLGVGADDLSTCIDKENGYLVTNNQRLQQLVARTEVAAKKTAKLATAEKKLEYHQLVSELNDAINSTDAFTQAGQDNINSILEQIDSLDAQIDKYQMLEQQILGTTNAFEKLADAQDLDATKDKTDDLVDLMTALTDAYENSEFGTATFETAFEGLIPEKVTAQLTDAGDKIQAGWEYLNGIVTKGWVDYEEASSSGKSGTFSIDVDNVTKFVEDALATAYGDSTVFIGSLESFDLNPQINTLEEFASAMGTTEEVAYALGTAISKYTTDNQDFLDSLASDSSTLSVLDNKIYKADQSLTELLKQENELGKQGKIGTDEWDALQAQIASTRSELSEYQKQANEQVVYSIELDSNIDEAAEKVNTLAEKLSTLDEGSVEYNATLENYEEAYAQLVALQSEKDELGTPTQLTIQAALEYNQAQIDSVLAEIGDKVKFDETKQLYVSISGSVDSGLQSQIDNLNSLVAQQQTIEAYVDTDDDDSMKALEGIQEYTIKGKKFTVTISNYKTILSQLDALNNKQLNNKTQTITITTYQKTVKSELTASAGTKLANATKNFQVGKYSGTAHASGSWGIPSSERNTLVGELGQELVVDPRTGQYVTVGDNGAQLVNLPKGAIVFNHRQTEGLLKYGKINTRGKALFAGNAMLDGNARFSLTTGKYTFGNTKKSSTSSKKSSSSSSSSSSKVSTSTTSVSEDLEEKLQELAEAFDDTLGILEHNIKNLSRNGGSLDQIVNVYNQIHQAINQQINKYRALGLDDNNKYIRELQEQWWTYEDEMGDAVADFYDEIASRLENAADRTQQNIDNAIKVGDIDSAKKYTDEIISYYTQLQDVVHEEAEYYRRLGYNEMSDEITECAELWNEYQDNIVESVADFYDDLTGMLQNAVDLAQSSFENAGSNGKVFATESYANQIVNYYKQLQERVHEQAEYYRQLGYDEMSDEISELGKRWWEYENSINDVRDSLIDYINDVVTATNDMIDAIQNANDVLHDAADEYKSNGGYISVDTYQSILDLGTEYMQYLMDENGLLIINEERINNVIAAKTKQLALDQAMTYVERLNLALRGESNESLNELLYATTETSDATWGLVYANLALLDLSDDQYQAAVHNINALRSLADNAAEGIYNISDAYSDSLSNMNDGIDDLIEYVMDMLEDRIEHQVEDLEDMKDAFQEIVDLRKEALEAAKDEADYDESVAEKTKEIAKLQSQINALSLDDSRDAQVQRASLMEEMQELQKDLSDLQSDHAREAQEDALDDMADNYSDVIDGRIDELEDSISSYQKKWDAAVAYINNNWGTLYKELIDYNYQCGNSLNSEITSAWENAIAAAEKYGYTVEKIIAGLKIDLGTDDDTTVIEAIVKQMVENSSKWSDADAKTQEKLAKENSDLGKKLASYGVVVTRGDDGTWYLGETGSKKLYDAFNDGTLSDYTSDAMIQKIVKQMLDNSSKWTDDAAGAALAKENEKLGSSLSKYGVAAVRGADGVWYLDKVGGRQLYDAYENGTLTSGRNTIVSTSSSDYNEEEMVKAIINRMYQNSTVWGAGSDADNKKRADENLQLGAKLANYGITAIRGSDGVWYLDRIGGKRLYDVYSKYCYHTGGIVGDSPDLDNDEVLALLQKGEMVLTKKQETGLYKMVDFISVLSDKLGSSINASSLVDSFASGSLPLISGMPKYDADSLNAINSNNAYDITFGNVYITGTDDEAVQKHIDVNRKFVNEVLSKINVRK